MSETPNGSGSGSGYTPSEEAIAAIQAGTGAAREVIRNMPEMRIARLLQKLEIPNRPLARIEHERDALLNDNREIPEESYARAQAQLSQMRSAIPSAFQSVAGVPTGNVVFSTDARVLSRTAGLMASNTGWAALGPGKVGGRTRALVIDPTNPKRIFAAGAGGGVWRTLDGGLSWMPTDDFMANLAVCSLVMDPANPNILYAGTGEGYANVDAIRGDGIFKTNDGGTTWTALAATSANEDFFYVNGLAIAGNGQILLAATTTGIFRSTNGGQSWTQSFHAGMGNIAIDPNDASKAVAGGLNGNLVTRGKAYFSTDGGVTWHQATGANAVSGRIQVCYAAADSSTVYASVDANPSQIWRSTNGGASYSSRNATWNGQSSNFLGGQGWYDNVLWAGDPTNVNLLLVGGVDLWRSTDGGHTLRPITTWWSDQSAHADHHAIVADPGYNGTTNKRVYFGNDGGVYRTDDVTTVGNNPAEPYTNGWVNLNNGYGVTQFYYGDGHIATNTIMGGAQDNGTLRYTPTQGPNGWNEVWGGDGGDVASDPSDSQVWYGEYVYLQIFRDTSGGASASLGNDYICGRYWNGFRWAWKPLPFTIPDAQNEQAQFIAPFELDPNDPNRLLGGAMSLWRTNDAKRPNRTNPPDGPSWAAIKDPIGSNPRVHSITAIAIAYGNADIVVVGHANGDIYRTTNATATDPTWQQIDTNGINANRQCLALTIDPDDHDLIYAAYGGFQADNLWRTTDGGQSWINIGGALPE
ncbi:MAG TPA: hypothetical protein P5121_37125, partial [Caldilineaceae bacterium]|nr:hypothetical protein [Caldilineaceae bacterium]